LLVVVLVVVLLSIHIHTAVLLLLRVHIHWCIAILLLLRTTTINLTTQRARETVPTGSTLASGAGIFFFFLRQGAKLFFGGYGYGAYGPGSGGDERIVESAAQCARLQLAISGSYTRLRLIS
jgi:hypothetical protein